MIIPIDFLFSLDIFKKFLKSLRRARKSRVKREDEGQVRAESTTVFPLSSMQKTRGLFTERYSSKSLLLLSE